MTPIGIPPSRPRPITTVFAQPLSASTNDPLSKKPDCQVAFSLVPVVKPLNNNRGS
eukprot:CAMPEP_0119050752 /NCGR_PEP_ID=MMETSP1177-20130426/71543_1 /TAXON_ID=2985 /ORGANISM="Ochromonas sp, Strain CCMP1899" /LENGTH=55 /DNA_ID=CAMNT_0007029493 /DNA_START=1008 /DNA_END=1175 /DNA_ORIENTATION=-